MTAAKRTLLPWQWLLISLLGTMLMASLGVWQLSRAQQKRTMQHDFEARAKLPSISAAHYARTPEQAAQQYYYLTQVRGKWLAGDTRYLQNRTWVDAQAQVHTGYLVITPLEIAPGLAVLVQRGWLPRSTANLVAPTIVQLPQGGIELAARIVPPPSHFFSFVGQERTLVRQNIDLDDFAKETGLKFVPFSLQQMQSQGTPDGLTRHWTLPHFNIAMHYGYAVQWFALSTLIVILYVWFQLIAPRRTQVDSHG